MNLQGMMLLSYADCERIHNACLDVLEETGITVFNERGRELLSEAGAEQDGDVIKIPREMVQQALEKAPKRVPVYDRCGSLVMDLHGHNSYFGAGGSTVQYYDEKTETHRPFVLSDCARLARVCDACKHLSFNMAMAHSSDVPVEVRDIYEVATTIYNSSKPIIITANSPENVSLLAEIFKAASGENDIEKYPYGIFYSEPISPLKHASDSLDKVWVAVAAGFPLLYTPAPMAGATGPATLAGNIVLGTAEWLSGLVMVQLYKAGAPVIYGGVFSHIDYKTTIMPYGSPDVQLQTIAIAEMGHYYGLPSFGTAGCSDASTSDPQSSFEAGVSNLLNMMAGANLVHDVGWLASANAASAEQLVINDELIAHCRRLMKGIEVNENTLAVEIIKAVGQQGTYLDQVHTLDNYKNESYFPGQICERRPMKIRKPTDPNFKERVITETNRLLKEHKSIPMGTAEIQTVDALLKERCADLQIKSVPDWKVNAL